MPDLFPAIAALVIVVPSAASPQAPEYDTSGLQLFWETVDILVTDRSPTDAEWDRLLQHPGYAQIERQGSRAGAVRRCMPLVFRPSERPGLDAALEEGNSRVRRICAHLDDVRERRQELERFASTLAAGDELGRALGLTAAYLPEDAVAGNPPPVYVILFGPNGFGGSSLALDELLLMQMSKEQRLGYLAHEFHHAFRNRVEELHIDREAAEYALVAGLSSLASEGIASMLDKRQWLDAAYRGSLEGRWREVATTFEELFNRSETVLATVDAKLTAVATGDSALMEVGPTLKGELPWGGHPTGMYMARAIEAAQGRESLADLSADPLEFVLAYQTVAEQEPDLYQFSEPAIQFVSELQRRFSHDESQ